jgi:hypothetical protein
MVKQERSPKVLKSFLDNSTQQRHWLVSAIFFMPGMNTISISSDPASCIGFGITAIGFGMTVVGVGMTVVSIGMIVISIGITVVGIGMMVIGFGMMAIGFGTIVVSCPLPPVCFWDVVALLTNVMLPDLMFGETTPEVVISSSDESYDIVTV